MILWTDESSFTVHIELQIQKHDSLNEYASLSSLKTLNPQIKPYCIKIGRSAFFVQTRFPEKYAKYGTNPENPATPTYFCECTVFLQN